MDAALLGVVESRNPAFKKFLDAQGAQTCSDVRFLWSSGQDMLAAYERTQGRLESDEAFQLLLVYIHPLGFARPCCTEQQYQDAGR